MRRIDAIGIIFGVFVLGGLAYVILTLAGFNSFSAGIWSQFLLVGGLIGWLLSYVFRAVGNKMTYHQQREAYEKAFLQNQLDQLSPEQRDKLFADVENLEGAEAMSESMAFIGGVAVAGLAALLLLKGSGNAQPNFSLPQVQQAPVVAPQMSQPGVYPGVPYPNQFPPVQDTAELRTQLERQKTQFDALQRENDQLKNQTQQLQTQIQTYYQSQLNAQHNQNPAQQSLLQPQEPWWSSNILWAVGGMALTVGGGIVVAGVSALFSQKDRPTRTVQVIHPYNGSGNTISPPVRRAEFLPPRSERRMEAPEYDDNY